MDSQKGMDTRTVCIGIGIELLFYLGKPLAMRLLHKAPRTVQHKQGNNKKAKKKKKTNKTRKQKNNECLECRVNMIVCIVVNFVDTTRASNYIHFYILYTAVATPVPCSLATSTHL